ncbi:hypothetical protein HBH64_231050 [Parastagonospora nodorum]|nr:hypothetical protein HBI10_193100 [Parastagonospora nodorum]KAH4008584.1 hypothetical protein HBI13_232800 [Parastagonospora nodorum]KAH4062740.1 hypothetical protein HBH50_201080 [Parastagonospora nodorum]KAH4081501.1 hypothetical protein HBH48_196730 [Parastagonospora nodorum]KAH4285179.1 hypothetical protein HBI02_234390 [Parastagonospora nodorum]
MYGIVAGNQARRDESHRVSCQSVSCRTVMAMLQMQRFLVESSVAKRNVGGQITCGVLGGKEEASTTRRVEAAWRSRA